MELSFGLYAKLSNVGQLGLVVAAYPQRSKPRDSPSLRAKIGRAQRSKQAARQRKHAAGLTCRQLKAAETSAAS